MRRAAPLPRFFVMKDDNLAVTASQLLRTGEAAVLRAVVDNDNLEFQII